MTPALTTPSACTIESSNRLHRLDNQTRVRARAANSTICTCDRTKATLCSKKSSIYSVYAVNLPVNSLFFYPHYSQTFDRACPNRQQI